MPSCKFFNKISFSKEVSLNIQTNHKARPSRWPTQNKLQYLYSPFFPHNALSEHFFSFLSYPTATGLLLTHYGSQLCFQGISLSISVCVSESVSMYFLCSPHPFGFLFCPIQVCLFYYFLDAYCFLMTESKKRCGFRWMRRWKDLDRIGGGTNIIVIYCMKNIFPTINK